MLRYLLATLILSVCTPAFADLQSLGTNFRIMLTNDYLFSHIKAECPHAEIPKHAARQTIEQMFQQKLGIENYLNTMRLIMASDLRANAQKSYDKLWGSLKGCDDPGLDRAIGRIINAHEKAFEAFRNEPGLVTVPVPMRR